MSTITPWANVINTIKSLLNTPIDEIGQDPKQARISKAFKRLGKERRSINIEEQHNNTSNFTLEGRLEKGANTDFAVMTHDIAINSNTWVFGELEEGIIVKVEGCYMSNGKRLARKISPSEKIGLS